MKIKIKLWYPYYAINEEVIKIDIPDDVDIDEYLFENRQKILINEGAEEMGLSEQLDVGIAGVKYVK